MLARIKVLEGYYRLVLREIVNWGVQVCTCTQDPEERDMFEHMQPSVRDPEWDVREARILAREEAFEREGACVREGNGAGQTQAGSNLSS